MDEKHYAEREINQSRERMSELAEELARRASPAYVKDRAREMAMDQVDRAKEKAMQKTQMWKEQATRSPKPFGILGALAGWVVGQQLFKYSQQRAHRFDSGSYDYNSRAMYDRDYPPSYGTQTYGSSWSEVDSGYDTAANNEPGFRENASQKLGDLKENASLKMGELKGSASDTMSNVKERTSEAVGSLKERASGFMHSAKERIPSRYELRDRASGVSMRAQGGYDRMVHEQPLLVIASALALGSLAAFLVPVTNKERQVLQPAKDKVREKISQVGDQVESKLGASQQSTDFNPPSESLEPQVTITTTEISTEGRIASTNPSDFGGVH